jgi:hypothetical protein
MGIHGLPRLNCVRASGAHNVEKLLRTSQRKFPAKTVLRFCIFVAILWYLSTFFGRDATAPVPVKNDIRSAAPTEVLRLTAQEISTGL